MKKINKNKGLIFWITGISGSGKTTLSKKISNFVKKNYGPTLVISGDDLRDIFKITGYSRKKRLIIAREYSKFCKLISDQKINIIFATGSLFHEIQKMNKRKLNNYIEIFINSEIKILKSKKNKSFYKKKTNDVWGLDIIPQFPKNPDIILTNNYNLNTNQLSKKLISKIKMLKI
tara:strand:+ start:393 stop:917 length:525 start_codon:yes stop_codon:yes gene_type:complete